MTYFTAKYEKHVAMHHESFPAVDTIFMKPLLTLATTKHFVFPQALFAAIAVLLFLVFTVMCIPF
jgi:hypothetical protein